jgi:hypothetical protein
MTGAHGCSILVYASEIYSIHKHEKGKTKRKNEKDKSIIQG